MQLSGNKIISSFIVILLCIACPQCFSQSQYALEPDNGHDEQIPGQIVYNDTTVNVRFIISTFRGGFSAESLQRKIQYLDDDGVKRSVRPKHAKAIQFCWDNQDIVFISRRPPHHGTRKKFLHVWTSGKVTVCEYIQTYHPTKPYIRYTMIYPMLQRENEKMIVVPDGIGFRKKMMKYFEDCPRVSHMIDAKFLRREDIVSIVDRYNLNNDCE